MFLKKKLDVCTGIMKHILLFIHKHYDFISSLQELVKVDKQETPDSTTKERNFFEGEEIFVLRNDQFVFGKIEEVCNVFFIIIVM